jgi:hypothetical protein
MAELDELIKRGIETPRAELEKQVPFNRPDEVLRRRLARKER